MIADTAITLLPPLPSGEGWGEGELKETLVL
jgi:hypothetical protein